MRVMKKRCALKGSKITINDDVCRDLYLALNRARNDDRVKDSWSWNGKIFVKDQADHVHQVRYGQSLADVLANRRRRLSGGVSP